MFIKLKKQLKKIISNYKYRQIIRENVLPKVLSEDETINTIISGNNSISRFGDGEFLLIKGKDLGFQKATPNLSKDLQKVLFSESESHLVCLPNVYVNLEKFKNDSQVYWKESIGSTFDVFTEKFNFNKYYGSSFISRFYMIYKSDYIDYEFPQKLKSIWDEKHLIIVEGKQSRLGIGNDLFSGAKSIKRILCPSVDAYSKKDQIKSAIQEHYQGEILLLAMGPTATVLAYELSQLGIMALDIGHVDIEYEWMNARAKKKIQIPNKHVNEVSESVEYSQLIDSSYTQQTLVDLS